MISLENLSFTYNDADRPAVLTGSGVIWSQAAAELKEFIELTKIPLLKGRAAIPADHPLCLNAPGVGTSEADVLLLSSPVVVLAVHDAAFRGM